MNSGNAYYYWFSVSFLIFGLVILYRFLRPFYLFNKHRFYIEEIVLENEFINSIKRLGDFTEKISILKVGTKVIIDGPYGIFASAEAKRNKFLFIAGAIGITPIRAMVEEISSDNDSILIYANKNREEIAFENEFSSLECKIYKVFSNEQVEGSLNGYVDSEKISRLVADYKKRDVYLCGPQGMMDFVRKELKRIDFPKDQIHFEKFNY